jgi:hypothetical protein
MLRKSECKGSLGKKHPHRYDRNRNDVHVDMSAPPNR